MAALQQAPLPLLMTLTTGHSTPKQATRLQKMMLNKLTERLGPLQFPVLFFAAMIALMSAYYSLPTLFIENTIVRFFAVIPSGIIVDWLTPGYDVSTEKTRIISSIARINVLKGCEGTEVLLILYAAVLSVMRPWKYSVIGVIAGTALVFVLNQVRIVSLFFIAAYHKNFFELVHGFLAPVIIIVITSAFFLLWFKWAQPIQKTNTG